VWSRLAAGRYRATAANRLARTPRLFRFVQFEIPGRLGPDPGRYVVRRFAGDEPQHVVVIDGLAVPARRSRLGSRRARPAEPHPEPSTVDLTVATVIDAAPLDGEEAAREWLACAAAPDRVEDTVAAALAVINRAIDAHRLGSADPLVVELGRSRPSVTRIGFGPGEEVASGGWTAAVEAPRPPRGRQAMLLAPQERVAALLAGRDVALACEELALRARLDLDAARHREAALQLRIAVDAALAELEAFRELSGVPERLEALHDRVPGVVDAAESALRGGLDDEACAAVREGLERLEAVLRARVAASRY
jgi:hypothetical protein